jgi:Txe/YoeB family toxin of Txe-Axe toxin-antitoxin module
VCEVVVKREGMEKFNELITRAQRKPFKVTEEYVLATIQKLKVELGIIGE